MCKCVQVVSHSRHGVHIKGSLAKEVNVLAEKKPTRKIGRDAGNGQFIPVKEAKDRPKTAVIETIKKGK